MMANEDAETAAAREIAQLISDLRVEAQERIRKEVEQELKKLDDEDFDPTRGRGRGGKWM